jgi:sulfide:quinone oxidoreductase
VDGRGRQGPGVLKARTALVVGAGIGGLAVARRLRRILPAGDRVVVVERERSQVFGPALLWYIVGASEPAQFTRPLEALRTGGIDLVHGEVSRIDPAGVTVEAGGRTIAGDAMVVALGA